MSSLTQVEKMLRDAVGRGASLVADLDAVIRECKDARAQQDKAFAEWEETRAQTVLTLKTLSSLADAARDLIEQNAAAQGASSLAHLN